MFSNVKGPECVFLWRAIGAALVSVVSVAAYSLKVRMSPCLGLRHMHSGPQELIAVIC